MFYLKSRNQIEMYVVSGLRYSFDWFCAFGYMKGKLEFFYSGFTKFDCRFDFVGFVRCCF